ncbi:hypothetical protein LCGC14_1111770 [marine sediment metagenome]|uniref:Uncharacterized protein n=1 Tax=marine sediment metagenome TaxID=412755 RepID=A0A0F9PPM2_9ZZZZ
MTKSGSELKFCPRCQLKGNKSKIHPEGGQRTQMAPTVFWDEEGELHVHDRNVLTSKYHCSRDHRWEESESGSCWCGWKAGE